MAARYSARMTAKRRFYFAQQIFGAAQRDEWREEKIICGIARGQTRHHRHARDNGTAVLFQVTGFFRSCRSWRNRSRASVSQKAKTDSALQRRCVRPPTQTLRSATSWAAGAALSLPALSVCGLKHLPQGAVVSVVHLRVKQRPAQCPGQQTRYRGDRKVAKILVFCSGFVELAGGCGEFDSA